VRRADALAANRLGIPTLTLMENAGRGLADVTEGCLRRYALRATLVVAARGNNGGDGLVAARHLRLRGRPVEIALVSPASGFSPEGDAGRNLASARASGVPIREVRDASALARLARSLGPDPLLVDAVLGTGLEGPVRAPLDGILAWMGASELPVVAADLPSGLDADTGLCLGPTPRCVATATFLALKRGLLEGRGPELAGRVTVCDIGVPLEAVLDPGPREPAKPRAGSRRGSRRSPR
jgi:NAD(P)H-hydrate epimerase